MSEPTKQDELLQKKIVELVREHFGSKWMIHVDEALALAREMAAWQQERDAKIAEAQRNLDRLTAETIAAAIRRGEE